MACLISIDDVSGVGSPGGTPSVIHVEGTATDCKQVTVVVDCGGHPFSATVPVAPDGSWVADLPVPPNSGCVCAGHIRVHVVCVDDPTCTKDFSGEIRCTPGEGCPTIGLASSVGDCNPDGTRAVTLTATIASATPGAAQFAFGDGTLGAAFAFPPPVHSETHGYAPGASYTAQLNVILPTGCPSATIAVGPLAACECPEVTGLTANVFGCAGGGSAATVAFTGTVAGSPTGCTYHWDFGDGSPDVVTSGPSATHAYATPGTFAVAVTLVCGACVRTTTVSVVIPPCCPMVVDVEAWIDPAANCAGGGSSAVVVLTATTNPAGAPGAFTWTFDDGTPPATTAAPTITHSYAAPGTKTVQVTFTPSIPGCPATTVSGTVSVPSCGGGTTPPPPPPPGGEGGGCTGLRWLGVILAILAALSLYICIISASACRGRGRRSAGLPPDSRPPLPSPSSSGRSSAPTSRASTVCCSRRRSRSAPASARSTSRPAVLGCGQSGRGSFWRESPASSCGPRSAGRRSAR